MSSSKTIATVDWVKKVWLMTTKKKKSSSSVFKSCNAYDVSKGSIDVFNSRIIFNDSAKFKKKSTNDLLKISFGIWNKKKLTILETTPLNSWFCVNLFRKT